MSASVTLALDPAQKDIPLYKQVQHAIEAAVADRGRGYCGGDRGAGSAALLATGKVAAMVPCTRS